VPVLENSLPTQLDGPAGPMGSEVDSIEVDHAEVDSTEVEIGLAAFLPEGVEVDSGGAGDPSHDEAAPPDQGASGLGVDEDVSGGDQEAFNPDLADQLEGDLEAVTAALARLDQGIYGTCSVCGATVPTDVLASDPVSETCGGHATVGT